LDIVPSSPTLTVDYSSASNVIGTVTANQITSYATEGEGSNTVSFLNAGSTVASLNQVFRFSNYYTVVVYQKSGQYGTFAVSDNNIALNNGTSQIRGVDAIANQGTNVDVYVTPGSSNNPTLVAANLISVASGGLAFGTATAYKSVTPGQYTVTITPAGVPGTVLVNQTVSLNAGQSLSFYGLDNLGYTTTTDDTGDS